MKKNVNAFYIYPILFPECLEHFFVMLVENTRTLGKIRPKNIYNSLRSIGLDSTKALFRRNCYVNPCDNNVANTQWDLFWGHFIESISIELSEL